MQQLCYTLAMLAILSACKPANQPTPQPAAASTSSPSVSNTPSSNPAPAKTEQQVVEELAAFYTGIIDGKDVILTLNADEKRTYTIQLDGNTISQGGWTVANGIVSLLNKKGSTQYEVLENALLPLNPDGSKRDKASSTELLLTKVMGE